MPKDTYDLKLGCYNCYHKWEQEFPFGENVEEGTIVTYLRCDGESIRCPNCGSNKTHKRHK